MLKHVVHIFSTVLESLKDVMFTNIQTTWVDLHSLPKQPSITNYRPAGTHKPINKTNTTLATSPYPALQFTSSHHISVTSILISSSRLHLSPKWTLPLNMYIIQHFPPKRRRISTTLHGVTFQKTLNFVWNFRFLYNCYMCRPSIYLNTETIFGKRGRIVQCVQ
jgi:hypothetical protein